uniref:Uncharacterized protein n=1 Tax=Schistosoma curassoni TaxID=6186 RepID=A0A183KM69_9TREM
MINGSFTIQWSSMQYTYRCKLINIQWTKINFPIFHRICFIRRPMNDVNMIKIFICSI